MNRRDIYKTINTEKDNEMPMIHHNRFEQKENDNHTLRYDNYNNQRGYSEYYSGRNSNKNSQDNERLASRFINYNQSNFNDLVLSPGNNYDKSISISKYSNNPFVQKRYNDLKYNYNTNTNIINSTSNNNFISDRAIKPSFPYLPKYSRNPKKTLILDLDETLVHSTINSYSMYSDFKVNVRIDNRYYQVSVLKRPFVDEFLKQMSQHYELVIFTASIPQYANLVIDLIDPNHLVAHRLFREHCVFYNNLYIKELKYLGRNLNETIIIDNNPISFAFNQDNGIPILTWLDNKQDKELLKMIPFLEYLAYVPDVKNVISQVKKGNTLDYNSIEMILNKSGNRNVDSNKLKPLNHDGSKLVDNDETSFSKQNYSTNNVDDIRIDDSFKSISNTNTINRSYYKENDNKNTFRKNRKNNYSDVSNDISYNISKNYNNDNNNNIFINRNSNNYNPYYYNNYLSQYQKQAILIDQPIKQQVDYPSTHLYRPNILRAISNIKSNVNNNNSNTISIRSANRYPSRTEPSILHLNNNPLGNKNYLAKSNDVTLPLLQSKKYINDNSVLNNSLSVDYKCNEVYRNNNIIRESNNQLYLDKLRQINKKAVLQ